MSVALGHALAGVVGGVVSTTITYPLLVTTNRLQTARNSTAGKPVPGYENALAAFQTILAEGPSKFFAGYSSAFVGTAYSNAIYYYLYQYLNELAGFITQHKPLKLLDNIAVAFLSGAATALASNPIWVINTRASVRQPGETQKSSIETAIELVKKDGILSLWAGAIPALILVLNPVINYVLFERLQIFFKGQRLTSWQLFWLSAFTKTIAAVVTHPILVIKTRLQAGQTADIPLLAALLKIIKKEGASGLFSGLSTKLVHSVLTSALLFLIKDKTTSLSINFLVLLGLLKISDKQVSSH